jgi:hypothetical protein
MRFKAVDSKTQKTASSEWPGQSISVPPRSAYRAVLSLKSWFGNTIDPSDITEFLFYTARAPGNYNIHVDNITLLAPGVEPPPLPEEYIRQVAKMMIDDSSLALARKALANASRSLEQAHDIAPATRDWLQENHVLLEKTTEHSTAAAHSADVTIEQLTQLQSDLVAVRGRAERLQSLVQLASTELQRDSKHEVLVGTAPATRKILPRDMPFQLDGNKTVNVQLAKNEHESFQVAVIPQRDALQAVTVELSPLVTAGGATLAGDAIDVRVVGYVKSTRPEYDVDYVGWWPDPLLDFLGAVDIDPGDAQTFWVRIKSPPSQQAGEYLGQVSVKVGDETIATLNLNVRIHEFVLPDESPLPLAITTRGDDFFPRYSSQPWETFKYKYADFLGEYYLSYDDLYRHGAPDMELITYMHDRGTLGKFNLGTLDYTVLTPALSEAQLETETDKLIADLRESYDLAKSAGVLDHAYIYGFDEVTAPYIPVMQKVISRLKQEFPDIPVMTTAFGAHWGTPGYADNIDYWCPVFSDYQLERASEMREAGKQVWWYTCQSPAHPYPNIFTEYPAIETRLMMGALTFKMGAEGFLYYGSLRDQGPPRSTIDAGPYTAWDPCCFIQPYNGEGYLIFPGKDGSPLASIRLENFRDGIDDYAYLKLLRNAVDELRNNPATLRADQKKWLARARTLLNVPSNVAVSPINFSIDDTHLLSYRAEVAEALDEFQSLSK